MGLNMNICRYFCKALICLNALVLHYSEPQHTSIHLKLYSFLHVWLRGKRCVVLAKLTSKKKGSNCCNAMLITSVFNVAFF